MDIESIQTAIKKNPTSASLYEKLGNLYRSGGKDSEAITAYKEAAHLNSTNHEVYLKLGILLEKRSLLDEAVVAYKQSLSMKADNPDAHLRLADLRNSRGLYQEAVTHYAEFLKLNGMKCLPFNFRQYFAVITFVSAIILKANNEAKIIYS